MKGQSKVKRGKGKLKNTMCSEEEDEQVRKDPVIETNEVNIRKLIMWMLMKQREAGLGDFYEKHLQNIQSDPYTFTAFSEHSPCNRYPDVVCLDNSRVKLKELEAGESDYIHANYLMVPKADRLYIAAQNPLPSSIAAFYRMVFYENVETIVCLTKQSELDCLPYWPTENGKFAEHGKFFVNCRKVKVPTTRFSPFTYHIEILPNGCSNSHIVTLLHYPYWDKNSLPANPRVIMKLLRMIKGDKEHPVLVTCDSGVNRAGLVIFSDIICQMVFGSLEQDVNVLLMITKVFSDLRNQRAGFIQNKNFFGYALFVFADYVRIRCKKYKIFPDIVAMVDEIEQTFIKRLANLIPKEPVQYQQKEKGERTGGGPELNDS